jgi:hypothetical protein
MPERDRGGRAVVGGPEKEPRAQPAVETAALPPLGDAGVARERLVMLFGPSQVFGLELAAPFELFLGLITHLWELDAELSGQVEGGLHPGPEAGHAGMKVGDVTTPPAAVAEEPVVVDVEARMLVVVLGVRAAPDDRPTGWFEPRMPAGELREVYTPAEYLEDSHLAHPGYHSVSDERPSAASRRRMGHLER